MGRETPWGWMGCSGHRGHLRARFCGATAQGSPQHSSSVMASVPRDQCGPGRAWGKEQLGNPRVRRWALPLGCITGPCREPFLLETVAGRMEMSLSAGIFPREHGLSQLHSLTLNPLSPRRGPSSLPSPCALLPPISLRKTPRHLGRQAPALGHTPKGF